MLDDNNSMATISTFDPLEIFTPESEPKPNGVPQATPNTVIGMELSMTSPSRPAVQPNVASPNTMSTSPNINTASPPPAPAQKQRSPSAPRSSPLRRDFDSQANKAADMLNRIEKELAHLRSENVRVSQELAEEQMTLLVGNYRDQLQTIQAFAKLFEDNGWTITTRPIVKPIVD
ncbi:hypothetical protein TrLO_g3205 [Triparma laevis f. longispina]|nr:hypothetical protein TrLO_g3205 [Triparma laevis f. longispina]